MLGMNNTCLYHYYSFFIATKTWRTAWISYDNHIKTLDGSTLVNAINTDYLQRHNPQDLVFRIHGNSGIINMNFRICGLTFWRSSLVLSSSARMSAIVIPWYLSNQQKTWRWKRVNNRFSCCWIQTYMEQDKWLNT